MHPLALVERAALEPARLVVWTRRARFAAQYHPPACCADRDGLSDALAASDAAGLARSASEATPGTSTTSPPAALSRASSARAHLDPVHMPVER